MEDTMLLTRLYVICFFVVLFQSAAHGGAMEEIGFGYGRELRENRNIAQYELFWRKPLQFSKKLGDEQQLDAALETAAAIVDENGSNNVAVRFSLMPHLILCPVEDVKFIFGFGTGFMAGDTEFTSQNLGGEFFLASKIGFWFRLAEKWGLNYTFYHQSNAGLYDYNASLNILQLSIGYRF